MPKTTPEMNELVNDYMRYCAERKVDLIAQHSADDADAGFFGVHTGLKFPDLAARETVDKLRGAPVAHSLDIETQGYYIGDFAWFLSMFTGECPDGLKLAIRGTSAMRRVDGEWKVCFFHVSEGVDRSVNMKPHDPKDEH